MEIYKKKQQLFVKSCTKNFCPSGHGRWRGQRPCPEGAKVFYVTFFQKSNCL
jgi:hypothetical protein